MSQPTCILVLGVCRSGTEAVARTLNLLGVDLPNGLVGSERGNPTGHREPPRLAHVNDRLLADGGSRWDDWRAFDLGSLGQQARQAYVDEIGTCIREEYGDSRLFAIEDPRIPRFVPLYQDALESMGIHVINALTIRNPLAVIASLRAHDELPAATGALLWLRHVLDAEASTRSLPRCVVSYEDLLNDWRNTTSALAVTAGLTWPSGPEASDSIDAFLQRELQHHRADAQELGAAPETALWVPEVLAALRRLQDDPVDADAATSLDDIRHEFERASKLFGLSVVPELASRDRRIKEAEMRAAEADQILTMVLRSRSWRFTARLRRSASVLRGLGLRTSRSAGVTMARADTADHVSEPGAPPSMRSTPSTSGSARQAPPSSSQRVPGLPDAPTLPAGIRALSDKAWLKLLKRSVYEQSIMGVEFPRFPPASVQVTFVGSANEDTLDEAFAFYALVKKAAREAGRPLVHGRRVLDFGCGWGRFLRFFWRDVDVDGLYGCDVDPNIIQTCRDLGVPGTLDVINPGGQLPYPDSYFDTVMAYSVFTHLPERVHLHWVREIARVTKPGATFALTIEPRRFLEFIQGIPLDTDNDWYRRLASFGREAANFRQQYDGGGVVFLPTNEGVEDTYGDAVVPLSFMRREWAPHFEIVRHIDDPRKFWQAVVVARRN